jgi:hypothetical protein
MVDVYQVVLGAIAVSIMILVPIGVVMLYDLLAGRWDGSIARWKESRQQSAQRRRNLRKMRDQHGVPLEQVAANLRRLRVVLTGDAHRSAAHQMGNRLAYDQVLIQACEMLEIEHDLGGESAGMERDIERLRVEAELEGAGVVLSERHYGQAA